MTYAWLDNEENSVDWVRQQIGNEHIRVLLDKFYIKAGHRLWQQIEKGICDPTTNAWAIYVTGNSLRSEPCREELAYALDRALSEKGDEFPLIGIFPGPVERKEIPAAIRTRLYVSLDDKNWISRVRAAVLGEMPVIVEPVIDPVVYKLHQTMKGPVIEARPRAGRWMPVNVAVPEEEFDAIGFVTLAPCNSPAGGAMQYSRKIHERGLMGFQLFGEANSVFSVYVPLMKIPSCIYIGSTDYMQRFELEKIPIQRSLPEE